MPRLVELVIGLVLVILCVGLEVWGVASISLSRAQGTEIGALESALVTTGAYAYCRHPITLDFAFGTPGFALVFDFIPLLVNTLIFTPIMFALPFYDERELLRRFGQEYELYRSNVPLLVPRMRES